MKKQPKISVIVPVYNSEKYLEKCINSIRCQTYENLQIICVDDGSTDKSPEILKNFEKTDKRITVIKQKNKGVGNARNTGLLEVSGDYVSFVDSDDWLLLTLYEDFVKTINHINKPIDIFMFNVASYISGVNDIKPLLFYDKSDWVNHKDDYTIHTFRDCMRPFSRNMAIYNKIYDAEFIKSNNLKFIENTKFEDNLFYASSMLRAKSIVFTEKYYYKYRNYGNEQSLSLTISKNTFDIFKIANLIVEDLKNLNLYDEFKYAIFQYKYTLYNGYYNLCPAKLKEQYFNVARHDLKISSSDNLDRNIYTKLRNIDIFHTFMTKSFLEFDKLHRRRRR